MAEASARSQMCGEKKENVARRLIGGKGAAWFSYLTQSHYQNNERLDHLHKQCYTQHIAPMQYK